ncbi:MAG: immunoglobulin domain-containing protein, partial [Limisphaerales bacterium]
GPAIITQPQSQTVVVGEPVTFVVNATSDFPTLQYQWLKNGVPISNATGSSYTITETAESDTGYYSVLVSNNLSTTPSRQAYLGVGSGTFSLLHYNIKGAFVSDFSTNSAQVQAIGRQLAHLQPDIITLNEMPHGQTWQITNIVKQYLPGYFWATNSGTDGTIRSVILSRWRVSRSQKWLDGSNLAAFGHEGTFTRDLFEAEIEVPGFLQPLHVFTTHLKSGSDLTSATRRAAEASAISNYFVNGFLTTNGSRPYILTGDLNEDINRPRANEQQAVQRIRNSATGIQLTTPLNPFTGDDRTFSIQSLPLAHRYDYILPSSSLSSHIATSQVFRTSVISPLPSGLNANDDSVASDHLPVYIEFNNPFNVPPILIAQPADVTVALGSTATFSVEASSAVPATYLWLKNGDALSNGGNISGVSTPTLTVSSVGQLDAAVYSVVVSNQFGAVTSQGAALNIAVPPSFISQPT